MLSRVRLFATPWSVAHQAPLVMEFPRQEYWSRLPFLTLGGLPNHLHLLPQQADGFITTAPPERPLRKE